jgi:hypothetical protein
MIMDKIKIRALLTGHKDVPTCCRECMNFEADYDEGYLNGYWCKLNIFFPYKKQCCKKQIKL